MEREKKKKTILMAVTAAIIVCLIIILLLLIKSCGAEKGSESASSSVAQNTAEAEAGIDGVESILSPEDGSAEITEKEDFGIEDLAMDDSFPQSCMKEVKLYVVPKYGKPSVIAEGPDPKYESESDAQQFVPVVIGTKEPPRITIQPTPSPAPSSGISVFNPKAGSVLTAGSEFTLEWKIESGRNITVDVLLSTDGGKSFKAIEKGDCKRFEAGCNHSRHGFGFVPFPSKRMDGHRFFGLQQFTCFQHFISSGYHPEPVGVS